MLRNQRRCKGTVEYRQNHLPLQRGAYNRLQGLVFRALRRLMCLDVRSCVS